MTTKKKIANKASSTIQDAERPDVDATAATGSGCCELLGAGFKVPYTASFFHLYQKQGCLDDLVVTVTASSSRTDSRRHGWIQTRTCCCFSQDGSGTALLPGTASGSSRIVAQDQDRRTTHG
ncbi:uncharacterized protein LOC118646639 [Monomorium pharaonis]|uniref:uncharacterized protein LOC118646639 n=1 Tax=Monomorium pharaonis TaxID=307658 RepID=UPI001746FDD1|nr:uncharacterized protein LOC118646639 [Monomorium pharaonis]